MKYSEIPHGSGGRHRPVKPNRLVSEPGPAAARQDPGPRPLSDRQRAYHTGRLDATVARVKRARPGTPRGHGRTKRVVTRRRNRLRPNYPRLVLRASLCVLFVECVVALLFSPRLWVRTVRFEGNQTVSAQRLFRRAGIEPGRNILTLPVGRIRRAVEAEPAVARATVHRRLPHRLVVKVRERAPWASVQVGGVFYTVDRGMVPFRKNRTPEAGLACISLETAGARAPRLGKQIVAPGLAAVNKCLNWAAARDDFPLDKIRVDQTGKLCLNRAGGSEVRLGSGKDLDRKLDTLALLLARRADLREGGFDYVVLYAYDAPAIRSRTGSTTPRGEAL